jgi:hypothetical protein
VGTISGKFSTLSPVKATWNSEETYLLNTCLPGKGPLSHLELLPEACSLGPSNFDIFKHQKENAAGLTFSLKKI